MDSDKISCFLTLANTLSFTRAAEMLYKSQPVLSRQISLMEEELGVSLFVRDSKSVSLTPAGEYLIQGLGELRGYYSALISKAKAIQDGFSGEIRIGIIESRLIYENYGDMLYGFEKAYPNIHLMISSYRLPEMQQMLHTHELDFVFEVMADTWSSPEYDYINVGKCRTCLVVPASHPLADKPLETLSLEDFKNDTFIVFSKYECEANHWPVTKTCQKFGFLPQFISVPNLDTLIVTLTAGRGVALFNDRFASEVNSGMRFLFLPGLGSLDESLIWSKNNISACNKVLIKYVQDYIAKKEAVQAAAE